MIRKKRVVVTQEAATTSEKSLEATLELPAPVTDSTSPQQAVDPSTPEPLIRKRRVVLTKEAVATPEKSPEATLEPPTPMADTTSPQQAANPSTPEVQTTQSCLQTLLP